MLFERSFIDTTVEEITAAAADAFTEDDDILSLIAKPDVFVLRVVNGVYDNQEIIDKEIESHLINWNMNRITRVSMCLMRMAVYEMMFEDSIPVGVSINEAVEFAKIYAGKEETAFINGVLGAAAKNIRSTATEA